MPAPIDNSFVRVKICFVGNLLRISDESNRSVLVAIVDRDDMSVKEQHISMDAIQDLAAMAGTNITKFEGSRNVSTNG